MEFSAVEALATGFFSLIAAIIGGLIAGTLTRKAASEAHHLAIEAQASKKEHIRSFLQAILDDCKTVWQQYQDEMGSRVEALEEDKPLDFFYLIISDYFTIYHMNAILLPRVENEDLRRAIVTTYTKGKGLLDSFRLNNDLVQKYDSSVRLWTYSKGTASEAHFRTQALMDQQGLVEYAKVIRRLHADVKNHVAKLLRDLRKELQIPQ